MNQITEKLINNILEEMPKILIRQDKSDKIYDYTFFRDKYNPVNIQELVDYFKNHGFSNIKISTYDSILYTISFKF